MSKNQDQSCSICLSDDQNTIRSPCLCTGSVGNIHFECLQRWIRTQYADSYAATFVPTCSICRYEYHIEDVIDNRNPLVGTLAQNVSDMRYALYSFFIVHLILIFVTGLILIKSNGAVTLATVYEAYLNFSYFCNRHLQLVSQFLSVVWVYYFCLFGAKPYTPYFTGYYWFTCTCLVVMEMSSIFWM